MDWDIRSFMKSQFKQSDNPDKFIGSVITLSGSALHAQATTCTEYVKQTWPTYGLWVLEELQWAIGTAGDDKISKKSPFFSKSIGEISMETEFDIKRGQCCIEFTFYTYGFKELDPQAFGDAIVEVMQQVLWLGAAFRTSDSGEIQYSVPIIDVTAEGQRGTMGFGAFRIRFKTSPLPEHEKICWHPLFNNPVIARGFPIPERSGNEVGLEIPIEIMAALGGARHATDYNGGLVLKGHSAMFVPVHRSADSIQWHLIRSNDESRLTYRAADGQCPNRASLKEVDYDSLQKTRAFLGWWRTAETHLGTADAVYKNLDWSSAKEAGRSPRFSGGSLGFQSTITGQISFIVGAKDGKLHFSQNGHFETILQCAEETPVLLYDQFEKRAWLTPALDIMLHIVFTRHHLTPYKVEGREVEIIAADPRQYECAAKKAVMQNASRKLFDDNPSTGKQYCFRDAILDLWSYIGRLMEKDEKIKACPGVAVHATMQSKLYGWEYMALVHERNFFRRKEQTLKKTSGDWSNLINDIDAVVLFARGVDEIIRPTINLGALCDQWQSLPKGKDYLAASIPMLELLYAESGSRLSRKHLTSTHLQWHHRRGATLFEECASPGLGHCSCDRLQQLYYEGSTFGHVRTPGQLEKKGCVIFGQAHHPLMSRPVRSLSSREIAMYIRQNVFLRILKSIRSVSKPGPQDGAVRQDKTSENSFDQGKGHEVKSPESPNTALCITNDSCPQKPSAPKISRSAPHRDLGVNNGAEHFGILSYGSTTDPTPDRHNGKEK